MELCVENLSKGYRKKKVFDGFSCTFRQEVTVLLGANGAGKSTLLNILSTALDMDRGRLLVSGRPVGENLRGYRAALGYVPQGISPYPSFTAGQFLAYLCRMKEIPKARIPEEVAKALETVRLTEAKDVKTGKFSGGMKQRLIIAQGLLGDPDILLLDEPTVGLDPKERLLFKQYLHQIAPKKIVVLSTHIVSDAEDLADRIFLIKEGQLLLQGTMEEITAQSPGAQSIDDIFMDFYA